MIYTMIFITIFLLFLTVKNIRNRYTWVAFLMVMGIDMAIFALAMYISKISNYKYPSSILFLPDYNTFLQLSYLRIDYYSIARILNIGIALYLLSVPFFVISYADNFNNRINAKEIIFRIFMFVFPLLYVVYSDPRTGFMFYRIIKSGDMHKADVFRKIIHIIDMFNYAWIFVYLIYPVLMLINRALKSNSKFFTKRNISLSMCFAVMNSFFILCFLWGRSKAYIYILRITV